MCVSREQRTCECNEATRVLKEELVHKAVQQMIQTLRPWELEQIHWTTEGDVLACSEGAVEIRHEQAKG